VCPEGEAIVSSEVAFDADGAISARLEQGMDRRPLSVADLQRQEAAGDEPAGGRGDDAPDDVEAVGSAIERSGRLAAHLGRERCELSSPDVGRIGHHDVEGTLLLDRGKEVAQSCLEALRRAERTGVGSRHLDGVGRVVGGEHPGGTPLEGEGDAHAAAAGAEIQDADLRVAGDGLEHGLHQELGLRTGDEHP